MKAGFLLPISEPQEIKISTNESDKKQLEMLLIDY
jgi:hypothetical protein